MSARFGMTLFAPRHPVQPETSRAFNLAICWACHTCCPRFVSPPVCWTQPATQTVFHDTGASRAGRGVRYSGSVWQKWPAGRRTAVAGFGVEYQHLWSDRHFAGACLFQPALFRAASGTGTGTNPRRSKAPCIATGHRRVAPVPPAGMALPTPTIATHHRWCLCSALPVSPL